MNHNHNHHHHEHRLFVIVCIIGIVSLLVMGGVNLYIENKYVGWGELLIGGVGILNLVIYLIRRNLDMASHVVLSSIMALFVAIMIDGGIRETGWMWVFMLPTLAFALKGIVVASWYTSIFGLYLATLTSFEIMEIDISVYSRVELIQLCAAYTVVSLVLSFLERTHEKIDHDYSRQSQELARERSELWQQRDQLRIFKTAVEQSREMMILTDPEGIVLWANAAAERVTGFTNKEIIGRKAGVLWGKLMDNEYYREMWNKVKKQKELFVGEIQNHRKNGEHFYSTISIYPILDKAKVVQYFVATQQDITEQKEVDQMKTDFVSLVSHQLRTPLSSMRWNLEMLLAGDIGKLSAKQKEVIKNTELANGRMIKLISTLLNISRIESGRLIVEPIKVDLGAYFKEIAEDHHSNVRGQKIKLSMPKGKFEVIVDPMLLRQIINNFVNNASKYSSSESSIEISLADFDDKYIIAVKDEGIGIPQSEQRRIFGKFFRASNVSKYETDGTGMGLYISYMLVKLLGGTIDFESRENVGTIFRVTLPKKGVSAVAGEVKLI